MIMKVGIVMVIARQSGLSHSTTADLLNKNKVIEADKASASLRAIRLTNI